MKKVVMLRTNRVDPDPRVEKEVNSLLLNKKVQIEIHAWDRTASYEYRKEKLYLTNGVATIHRTGIPAGWGVGIKKNAVAYCRYFVRTLKWLMKNHRDYDYIHACDLHTVLPAMFPIVVFKKKLVYDIYDYFSETAHGNKIVLKLSKLFETFVINHATATIICSEKREEQIRPANPKRLVILHNAPSNSQIVVSNRRICMSEDDKPKLVYVGNLVEDRCIREVVDIARKCPDVEVHIGGIGALERFVDNAAHELDNLYYYGKMAYEDVLELEKQCDIMVAFYDQHVPNHRYAAPNKFYEALALGKPIIMLHDTGVDDIVDQYKLGITVEQNIESMIEGIRTLISERATWDRIGEKAHELFENEYSWDIMEMRLNKLYSEIVNE